MAFATAATPSRPAQPRAAKAAPAREPISDSIRRVADAAQALRREADGDYARAATVLRSLRSRARPDADLELWLALNEARSGRLDSAWTRLSGRLLTAAMADTMPRSRWHEYDDKRGALWLNGRFDGWHWYVARARAELALRLGNWPDALAAARIAARALPLSGREQLLLAVAAGQAGDSATARAAAERAAALDPLLPEAAYLDGLWAWRGGMRARARASFQAAIALDSAYRAPALALVRLPLIGSRPDPLPAEFLTGVRRIVELASPERPKFEEVLAPDTPAGLYGAPPALTVPDSARQAMKMVRPIRLLVTVLVDEQGRAVIDYFPYLDPASLSPALLGQVLEVAKGWRFKPATRLGRPVRSWVTVEFMLNT